MKHIIRDFLMRQIMIGSMSMKAGTIAAAVASILVVGSTAGAVVMNAATHEENETEIVTEMGRQDVQQEERKQEARQQEIPQTEQNDADETGNMQSNILETDSADKEEHDVIENAHVHTFSTEIIAESTCTTQGKAVDTCTECGYATPYSLPLEEHIGGEWMITLEATESTEGLREQYCMNCRKLLAAEVIAVIPHNHAYVISARETATCEKDGYNTYSCTVCGSFYTETTEKTGHDYRQTNHVEADCVSDGADTYTCFKCSDTYDTVIPATGHSADSWEITKPATDLEEGQKIRRCTLCGNILETQIISRLPHICEHTYQVTSSSDATCTETGTTVKTCSICGDTETVLTPATGHTEGDWKTDSPATCTTDGSKHTECTNCGAILRTETIPATGHTMGDWHETTAAQCEIDGKEKRSCESCSYEESRSIPALGHNHGDWIVDEEATAGIAGSKYKQCSRCGDKITEEIEPLPPHEHSYSETSRTDSTCSNAGSVTYTCECGDSYSEEIMTKAHIPGEWTVKTPATEDTTGLEVRTCTVCGTETDSRVIDKLPHVHNYTTESKTATCTEDGYEKQTCACGSVINTVIPKTGHDEGKWITVQEAELGVAGLKELRCTRCNALLDTEEISMLTTDGTDSVYYFEVKNEDGTYRQEMVIGHYNEEEAQEMLALVNNYREENGLDTFTMPVTYMNSYTSLRAVETSYLWDHARPSGAGCEYAENIATGGPDGKGNTPSVQAIFDAWLASAGHKENLDATRIYNRTCISVFYKRCPVYNSEGEITRYAYIAYWVETFK